ncbi:MAG: ABC transporter, partial [Brevibacterium aurantiacum]
LATVSTGVERPGAGDDGDDGQTRAKGGFAVLHPSLGESISALRTNVRVGTHVFVEVDTSALHAYSVE